MEWAELPDSCLLSVLECLNAEKAAQAVSVLFIVVTSERQRHERAVSLFTGPTPQLLLAA